MYCGTKLQATRPCAKCARPLLASAPKCSFCGTATGSGATAPTASDVNRARTEIFQAAERHRSKEEFLDALRLYQQVIRADPTHARAYLGAARCLVNLKHREEALVTLDALLALQPDLEEARALRERVAQAPSVGRVPASTAGFADAGIAQMVERAFAFVAEKEWAKALAIFDALLSGLPPAVMFHAGNAPVHAYRAICLKRLSRLPEALAAADHAIQSDRSYSLAWANRGDVLDDLGRLDESIAAFDEAVRLDPKNIDAWVDRGFVLRKRGRAADALDSYDRALALNPRHAIALGNRGHALIDLGRLADAVASLEQALVVDPNQPAALASLRALVQKGLVDPAQAPILARAGTPASMPWSSHAEHFARELAKGFGLALDFTPASLRALDMFLDATFMPPEAPPGDDWQPREGQKATIAQMGSYLGEVFRRATNGAWMDGLNGNAAPYSTGVAMKGPSGAGDLLPFMTLFKRLKYGEGSLYAAYERVCNGAGLRAEGSSAAEWTHHVAFLAEQRFVEDALACTETAIAIDPAHALGHFWKGMLECELGRDGRAALATFTKLATNAPALAPYLEQARAMVAGFDTRSKLPPGRPGPTMLAALASGGPAEAFCFQVPSMIIPAEELLVVSWELHVPLREARELKVTPMVSVGARAHGISKRLEAVVGCYEETGREIDEALDTIVLRAWTAIVASRRIAKVTFVGNKPWSARAQSDLAAANQELGRRGLARDALGLRSLNAAELAALDDD